MNETVLWDNPLDRPAEEFIDKDWVKHVHCDGARWHVLSWTNRGTHCNEPRCIINRRNAHNSEKNIILKEAINKLEKEA